jgi:hypothetical protein
MWQGISRARKPLRAVLLAAAAAMVLPSLPASAGANPQPLPELNFAGTITPRPCAYESKDPHERKMYELEGWQAPTYDRYPGACQRLRFAYGPIAVKPGQNDILVEPVKIEKPLQDGYITRFKPNLVRADGSVPPVQQVHLHHGTWLSVPAYGNGPFFASGEEKTIAPFPRGYGLPVKATDQWLLLYMVHSAVSQPMETYITYDIDFVPKDKAEQLGIKPAYPIWLDVRPSGYPVFNVQRGYGARGTCTWPKQQCAGFDPYGKKIVGQGKEGNGLGEDFQLPGPGGEMGAMKNFQGGTLIGLGGHLHPGGRTNEVDLVRDGRSSRIFTSEANYWDRETHTRTGGPPTSWDFSMSVTGNPLWGVHVKPGDVLRSNATYDTTVQSTYENMGIVVGLIAPDGADGTPSAAGVDPFAVKHDRSAGCSTGGLRATRIVRSRRTNRRRRVAAPRLCERGVVTHGHYPENGNYGGPSGSWRAHRGSQTSQVAIADFVYAPGDLSMISMTGVPTVKLGSRLNFLNVEGPVIYHTVTSCKFPCLGQTGAAFPLADGETSQGRKLDFDSSELGIGLPAVGAASQVLNWDLPVTRDTGFKPGEVVTYFCRIHPFMRGAFEVTE